MTNPPIEAVADGKTSDTVHKDGSCSQTVGRGAKLLLDKLNVNRQKAFYDCDDAENPIEIITAHDAEIRREALESLKLCPQCASKIERTGGCTPDPL